MPFIEQSELFDKTDGGRLIIEHYYPQSVDSFIHPKRKFKLRSTEKTASASVILKDGIWLVTDFGDDSIPRNGIQVCMREEGIEFKPALDLLAALFNIVPEEKRAEVFKPEIRSKDANPEQRDDEWEFETKEFTIKELKLLLSPKIWEYLVYQCKDQPAEKSEELILKEVSKVFARYHFHSLKSYTIVKNRKAVEIRSTDIFPIFMFDEKDFKKIYKPREVLAANRFLYYNGKGPSDFLFGYNAAKKAYDDIIQISDEDEDEDDDQPKRKPKIEKLNHTFLVSGGSDALNLAVLGQCFKKYEKNEDLCAMFWPVWLNSETAKLTAGQFKNLQAISSTVYNIPDIDATGRREAHRVAMEYLDIKTLYLPDELSKRSDTFRKKPLKDLRDYFRYYKAWDFYNLIKNAYPYRFWDYEKQYNKNGDFVRNKYNINNVHLYNFLERNGFYRQEAEGEKDNFIYIHIVGNMVRKVTAMDIRDFIINFLHQRYMDTELINTCHRSNQLNEGSVSKLKFCHNLDFTDYDKESQYMHFANGVFKVTKNTVEYFKPGEIDKYVWEEEIINHKVKILPDYFTISSYCDIETREEHFDINIHNKDCMVFRYLINTSRMSWREELETRLDGIKGEQKRQDYIDAFQLTKDDEKLLDGLAEDKKEAYRIEHKWDIAGPLLTEREKREQIYNLVNKIFGIGFIFHRQKESGKPWCIWGMDAKLSDVNESHGGSGKSLLANIIYQEKLLNTQYREGRNIKLTENPHFWENTNEHTDLVLVDDCNRYLKFDFFFSAIGGPITVNPKHGRQFTIPADLAPKMWFTSNFPPYEADISMERRIIYMLYSDYYHYNKMGEYREDRSVLDEFGKNFGREFTETEWNLFMNFIMQCVKFYLNCSRKINPPMDNVNKRNLKSTMGDNFEPWADVFFSRESGRLDQYVVKDDAMADYIKSANVKQITPHKFSKMLHAWCHYNGYILNPTELLSGHAKRIIKRITVNANTPEERSMTKEHIYIKTKPVTQGVIDRYEQKNNQLPADEELPF